MVEKETIRTRLASRTSFFGGAVNTRDYVTIGKLHWNDTFDGKKEKVDMLRGRCATGHRTPVSTGQERERVSVKKSIVPASYPVKGGQSVKKNTNDEESTRISNEENQAGGKGRGMASRVQTNQVRTTVLDANKRPLSQRNGRGADHTGTRVHRHDTKYYLNSKSQGIDDAARCERVKRKGTFYGQAQPPSAIQPVPQRPSYSDQSDDEFLIDDENEDTEDVSWVGELMKTLGAYATRDFSKIDAQRDSKMHASFDQIMHEEDQTARIGQEIDRQEARKEQEKRRKRTHTIDNRRRAHISALILSSSSELSDPSDDDDARDPSDDDDARDHDDDDARDHAHDDARDHDDE